WYSGRPSGTPLAFLTSRTTGGRRLASWLASSDALMKWALRAEELIGSPRCLRRVRGRGGRDRSGGDVGIRVRGGRQGAGQELVGGPGQAEELAERGPVRVLGAEQPAPLQLGDH